MLLPLKFSHLLLIVHFPFALLSPHPVVSFPLLAFFSAFSPFPFSSLSSRFSVHHFSFSGTSGLPSTIRFAWQAFMRSHCGSRHFDPILQPVRKRFPIALLLLDKSPPLYSLTIALSVLFPLFCPLEVFFFPPVSPVLSCVGFPSLP